jgi:MFS transporter, UMF1 family
MTTVIALAIAALIAPFLGALADTAPVKKKIIGVSLAFGATATAAMWFIGQGDWLLASLLFGVGNIAATASFVAYDGLLPHVAHGEELDRLSTAGYALGYVGGGVLLAINVAMTLKPAMFGFADAGEATRAAFVSVAVWWALFSIPLFLRVSEPPVRARREGSLLRSTLRNLARTSRELKRFPQALLLLTAFLIYNDGIGTIIRLATAYGEEIGLDTPTMITAILLVQFIGIPSSFLFGQIAGKIGTRRAIFGSLAVYIAVSLLGYGMSNARDFYMLAILVGMVQGGSQALSRSLFASMIPRQKSGEFFGLFAVFEKFAGILGPGVFAAAIAIFGSSKPAILSVSPFFIVGAVLLAKVDVEAGQRAAREAEAAEATPEA